MAVERTRRDTSREDAETVLRRRVRNLAVASTAFGILAVAAIAMRRVESDRAELDRLRLVAAEDELASERQQHRDELARIWTVQGLSEPSGFLSETAPPDDRVHVRYLRRGYRLRLASWPNDETCWQIAVPERGEVLLSFTSSQGERLDPSTTIRLDVAATRHPAGQLTHVGWLLARVDRVAPPEGESWARVTIAFATPAREGAGLYGGWSLLAEPAHAWVHLRPSGEGSTSDLSWRVARAFTEGDQPVPSRFAVSGVDEDVELATLIRSSNSNDAVSPVVTDLGVLRVRFEPRRQ